jgi:hypothetical protein
MKTASSAVVLVPAHRLCRECGLQSLRLSSAFRRHHPCGMATYAFPLVARACTRCTGTLVGTVCSFDGSGGRSLRRLGRGVVLQPVAAFYCLRDLDAGFGPERSIVLAHSVLTVSVKSSNVPWIHLFWTAASDGLRIEAARLNL